MLHERLYERDPSIDLRDMRMFQGERMRVNGWTLLRRPRLGLVDFPFYLHADALPTLVADCEIYPLPLYRSPDREADELVDDVVGADAPEP